MTEFRVLGDDGSSEGLHDDTEPMLPTRTRKRRRTCLCQNLHLWGMTVLALLLVIISIQLSYLVSSADALVNINIKRNHETAKNNHGSIASLSSSLRRDDHTESHSSDAKQAALLAKLLKGLKIHRSFVDVWLTDETEGFVLGIPQSALGKAFLVNNMLTRAPGKNYSVVNIMADFDTPVYKFELSPDKMYIHLLRMDLERRTTDAGSADLTARGSWSGLQKAFRIKAKNVSNFTITRAHGRTTTTTTTDEIATYYVDFMSFALKEVFGLNPVDKLPSPGNPLYSRIFCNNRIPSGSCVSFAETAHCRTDNRTAELNVLYQFQDGASIELLVSLFLLPDSPMQGRWADDRIGYFTTQYVDVGMHVGKDAGRDRVDQLIDTQVTLINRWRLERPLGSPPCTSYPCPPKQWVDPVKPLRYYVDPSIPPRWREAVAQGIEVWQTAFQAIGFSNTPVAVLPGGEDWPADYEAGSMRYNVVGFSISPGHVFAIGLSTVDPRSGEILKADVGFAQEWIHYWTKQVWLYSSATGAPKGVREARHDLEQCAQGGRDSGQPHAPTSMRSRRDCTRALTLAQHESSVAMLAAASRARRQLRSDTVSKARRMGSEHPPFSPESGANPLEVEAMLKVVSDGIADVAAHEVGHTLGLRHNFKGTAGVSLSHLHDTSYTARHGLSASVMDYVPTNIAPPGQTQGHYFTGGSVMGRYDRAAIRYGYAPLQGETQRRKHPGLDAVVASSFNPRRRHQPTMAKAFNPGIVGPRRGLSPRPFAFATDHDANLNEDPLAKPYDQSDDPIAYATQQAKIYAGLRQELVSGLKWGGARALPKQEVARLCLMLMRRQAGQVSNALLFVGGVVNDHYNAHATGEGKVMWPVRGSYQLRALGLLETVMATEDALLPPAKSMADMVARDPRTDYSLQLLDLRQWRDRYLALLLNIVSDGRKLRRLLVTTVDAAPEDDGPPAVSEVLKRVTDMVLGGLERWRLHTVTHWAMRLRKLSGCRVSVVEAQAASQAQSMADRITAKMKARKGGDAIHSAFAFVVEQLRSRNTTLTDCLHRSR